MKHNFAYHEKYLCTLIDGPSHLSLVSCNLFARLPLLHVYVPVGLLHIILGETPAVSNLGLQCVSYEKDV